MPLPFLTDDPAAEDAGDDSAADIALPYEDEDEEREGWRRLYRPGPWRVGLAAVLLLLASYLLFAALIVALAGALPGAGGFLGAAVVVIAFALRLLRAGVWVSEYGLRRAGILGGTTLAWWDVASLRTVQQPVRWLGLPRSVQGQAVLVVRADGETLPLLTDHDADFQGRDEAFDVAADALEGWLAEHNRLRRG